MAGVERRGRQSTNRNQTAALERLRASVEED
jgi:hypothetical protein